jgi:predicted XRE-type DNA-binding protein
LDEHQPPISNLLRGRVASVSIEKLLRYADRMGLETQIAVSPIAAKENGEDFSGQNAAA